MKDFLVFMALLNLLLAVANIIIGNVAVGLFAIAGTVIVLELTLGK